MKIFIIDDDGIFQFVTKKLIAKVSTQHELVSFADGSDAFQFIQSKKENIDELPELIFLDINMPLMCGWQFLDKFRTLLLPKYKPSIYVVSSSVDQRDFIKSQIYTEIKGYLNKPLSLQQMTYILNSLT